MLARVNFLPGSRVSENFRGSLQAAPRCTEKGFIMQFKGTGLGPALMFHV